MGNRECSGEIPADFFDDCTIRCSYLSTQIDIPPVRFNRSKATDGVRDTTKSDSELQVAAAMKKTTEKPLTDTVRSGKINIEVEAMTPCLRKNTTGELVDTTVQRVSPTKATCKGWEFDWTKPERDGYQVFALRVKGERKIQGMIALKDDPGNYAINVDIVEAAPQNNPHNPANASGKKEYNGVGGHLFAEACRQSFKKGFDGYVYFTAKSNLIRHYEEVLGAKLINPRDRVMLIESRAAFALVQRYYGGGK